MWSPKTKSNGARNKFYDNMAEASANDPVISFADGRVRLVGRVEGPAQTSPQPKEFAKTSNQWNEIGWMLPVSWYAVKIEVKPVDEITSIRPLLPPTHSPIRPTNGHGNQGAYLAEINKELFDIICGFSGFILDNPGDVVFSFNEYPIDQAEIEQAVLGLSDTERDQVIQSRRGHGKFRDRTLSIEPFCRVTGLANPNFLIASHIKPWRQCETAEERLDGNNGLMLAAHVDRLFDRGYLTFLADGTFILSPQLPNSVVEALRLPESDTVTCQAFSASQATYLDWHRQHVFRT
ncbi:MAG: HNH endonuclease [Hyphomicrobiales bacterium]